MHGQWGLPVDHDVESVGECYVQREYFQRDGYHNGKWQRYSKPAGNQLRNQLLHLCVGNERTLNAMAAPGYLFGGWGEACSGTGSCTLTVKSNQSVTATFNALFALVITAGGPGSGTVTPSPAGTSYTGGYYFAPGTVVTLTANPSAGSYFTGFAAGGCSGSGNTCQVTMNTNQWVLAMFDTYPGPASGTGLTGTWAGALQQSTAACTWKGVIAWVLTQNGNSLTGSYTTSANLVSGDPVACGYTSTNSDSFQGTLNGNSIILTGTQGESFGANIKRQLHFGRRFDRFNTTGLHPTNEAMIGR